jgi:hypothetical protein
MNEKIANTQERLYKRESRTRKIAIAESLRDSPEHIGALAGGHKFIAAKKASKVGRFYSLLIDTIKVEVMVEHKPLSEISESFLKPIKANVYRARSKFKTKATIHSNAGKGRLVIEVSPSQYLTGQNIVGLSDMRRVAAEAVIQILTDAHIKFTEAERERIERGDMALRRVDCAVHCDCGTTHAARALMLAIRDFMVGVSSYFTVYGFGESVYHSIKSKAISLKAYLKGVQLRDREAKGKMAISRWTLNPAKLRAACAAAVRFEVVLRKPALADRGLSKVSDWQLDTAEELLKERIAKLLPLPSVVPNIEGIQCLGAKTALRLKLWLLGDKTAFDDAKTTQRKLRKEIIEQTGIDINSPLSVQRQREAVLVASELLARGLRYRDHADKWDRLKAGRFPKGSKPRAGFY